MAKRIVFSFDDGRLDTYTTALPIMEKYGIRATINITTDFILNPENYETFKSGSNTPMTIKNIKEMHDKGFEIAVHGNHHINNVDDTQEGIKVLNSLGIDDVCGFASPHSEINEDNFTEFKPLLDDNTVKYIRSGLQVRRQGLFYTGLYVLQNILKSKHLFYLLNKKTFIKGGNAPGLLYGISISCRTTVKQIMYLINKIPDNSAAVFIFHSVLEKGDPGIGKDKWYFMAEEFERLCREISENKDFETVKNNEII